MNPLDGPAAAGDTVPGGGTLPAGEGSPPSRRARREQASGARATGSRRGLAAAAAADFSLAQAVGGPRGVVEATVPSVLFIVGYALTRDLTVSLTAAVGAALILMVARALMGSPVTQAAGGLLGVVLCGVYASWTGEARDFYLPGLLINVGYGLVLGVSVLRTPAVRVRRWTVPPGPWPVLGLALSPLLGEGTAWRRDPARMRAYRVATSLFVVLFALRLLVQVPLFLADAVDELGVARLAMGVPAFALTVWLAWRILRSVPASRPSASSQEGPDGPADADGDEDRADQDARRDGDPRDGRDRSGGVTA